MSIDAGRADGIDLWMDVGNLLSHVGNFTGIQRTIAQLLEVWFRDGDLSLRLCAFDRRRRVYREVPRRAVEELIEQNRLRWLGFERAAPPAGPVPPPSAGLKGLLREALARSLPADLQAACRHSYRAVWHLLAGAFKLGRRLTRLARRTTAAPTPEDLPPHPFAPGDVFVTSGTWDDVGSCEVVWEAKRTAGLRFVPLIYDVIPVKMRQCYTPGLPEVFEPWLKKVLWLADLVLTISQHSRGDLLETAGRFGLVLPPVAVLRLGDELGDRGRPAVPRGLPGRAGGPFVLAVGTVEVRKNHWLLYHLWRQLVARHGPDVPPLLLAGQPGWLTTELLHQIRHDPLVRDRVVVLPDVTDPELRWLYDHCLFTLYPSLYEGWGLPVAESLAHGKYCICSNASSLPEIAGDLVGYHDPPDVAGCLALVEQALFEDGFLAGAERRIRQHYRVTPWSACAGQLLEALEDRLGVRLHGAAADPGLGISRPRRAAA